MPTSLKDVAALAGVSITTASHALNGKRVNEKTRERVQEAAKKLKYHVNTIGKSLVTNRTNTIGMFILNSRTNRDMIEEISYYYEMLKGAMDCAQTNNYHFNFEAVYWEDLRNNELIEKMVFSRALDGVILVPQFINHYSFISTFDEEHFPYVIINPSTNVKPESQVGLDNFKGGFIAANHILELGHKKIVFINGPRDHYDSVCREKGFLTKLLQSGIKFDRRNIVYSDFTHDGGYNAMKDILDNGKNIFTAVFCANDYMATGAMYAIYEKGLKIPEDISVIGFDDTDVSRCVFPKLTTIKSEIRSLGFMAAERLFKIIENKQDISELKEIILEPKLIERGSSIKI